VEVTIVITDLGPSRICICEESLSTKFAIDAIVDVVGPAAERSGIGYDGVCKWLEANVIVKRSTTVFAGKYVF
jgi:hypothetical protein